MQPHDPSPSRPVHPDRSESRLPLLPGDFFGVQSRLTPREAESVGEIRDFFVREVAPIADDQWSRGEFARHLVAPLAALGLFGCAWPETRLFESSAFYRGWSTLEMARVDASTSGFVGVQAWLAVGALGVGASPEQRAEWMPRLASGDLVGSFALTEPQSGSDVARGLRTTATRRGTTWTLTGSKRWIGNATFADLIVVWARDTADGRVKGFLVDRESAGVTTSKIERKTSFRAIENADIDLREVRVDDDRRLALIDGFGDLATILRLSRPDVAWAAMGTALGAYEAAVRHVSLREQFGRPLGSFQLVQDLLACSLGELSAGIALCARTSALLDEGRLGEAQASLAKSAATVAARRIVAWCREVCGGDGIVLETGVARPFADAEALYSFEGTREVNSLIVGRTITGVNAFR